MLAGFGVFVLAGGAFVAFRWSQRGAHEASTADAIAQYRRDQGHNAGAGFLRPASGVYTYRAQGSERISVLGTTQQWGPTAPATVTRGTGECWALRIAYNTNHWEEQRYCPTRTGLLDLGQRIHQSFDFGVTNVGDTNVITCRPPGEAIRIAAQPGDSWRQSCTGRSGDQKTTVTSAGRNTFVGIEPVPVGGKAVPALHYRQRRTLSGDQTGTEDTELWFALDDGMVLRSTHDARVVSPSPVGDVTFVERGTITLLSRVPRR